MFLKGFLRVAKRALETWVQISLYHWASHSSSAKTEVFSSITMGRIVLERLLSSWGCSMESIL